MRCILREMDMCMSVVYQFLINIKPLTAKINKSCRVMAVTVSQTYRLIMIFALCFLMLVDEESLLHL